MTAMTGAASTVPHPFAKSPKPGLWHVKGMQLDPYIQNVAHALLRKGRAKDRSEAIQMAYGIVQDWANGKSRTGKVHPDVKAAAAKSIAQMNSKRAKAHTLSNEHIDMSNEHHALDGTFTPSTPQRDRLLRVFQNQHQLPATGILDDRTRELLKDMNKAASDNGS